MEQQQKTTRQSIQGLGVLGKQRQYKLLPIPALVGLRLFHTYLSLIIDFLPQLLARFPKFQQTVKQLSESKEDEFKIVINEELLGLLGLIPSIFTWERIEELARELLAGCTVEIDGTNYVCDKSGMCEAFNGNPVECYLAIVSAIMHNWAPFFSSLPMALGSDDSTLDSDQ